MMQSVEPRAILGFDTLCGRFSVRPVAAARDLFALCIDEPGSGRRELSRYRSINDAVAAVSRQETGHARWDGLPPRELPFRVHDIACWDFSQKEGTTSLHRESLAS